MKILLIILMILGCSWLSFLYYTSVKKEYQHPLDEYFGARSGIYDARPGIDIGSREAEGFTITGNVLESGEILFDFGNENINLKFEDIRFEKFKEEKNEK